jgi:UDP-N-acetylmuramyl pentapeptide phosphotransferase/UDP-N-acetylglucosamine-1-phosphate transferase
MPVLIITFTASLISNLVIVGLKKWHQHFSADWDLRGPQKFHTKAVPRIGGMSIAIGLSVSTLFLKDDSIIELVLLLLLSTALALIIGLAEDLTKKISPRTRLTITAIGAIVFIMVLDTQINRLNISGLDYVFLAPGISVLITVIAITGLTNAYNIIDGFNGLSSFIGIITLLALSYVSYQVGDYELMIVNLLAASSILGFFVCNYPFGYIFLGDGGAYFIGFWIACTSILMIDRNQEISAWFALLINGYPIIETLFTIYRRKIHRGHSPGQADAIHFHTLIYRRITRHKDDINNTILNRNARTSPYLWLFASTSILPALFFYENTFILMISFFVFFWLYLFFYKTIINFKKNKMKFLN